MVKFSVVIPVYNEQQTVLPLYLSLKNIMDKIREPYEIIFINDCSTDRSFEMLNSISLKPANLIIANLDKQSGQSTAMQAGFDIAQGEFVITMDADLQNDPEDIPRLLNKMEEGNCDVVCGWRYDRKDPWSKKFISKVVCGLRRIVTKENIHDFGCTLRVFRKDVLKGIYLSKGMHRFFVLLIFKLGYKIEEVKANHYPRRFGKSKYSICNRLFQCLSGFMYILLFDIHKSMKYKSDYRIKQIIRK